MSPMEPNASGLGPEAHHHPLPTLHPKVVLYGPPIRTGPQKPGTAPSCLHATGLGDLWPLCHTLSSQCAQRLGPGGPGFLPLSSA